jgi:hypothetical protein
MRQLRCQQRNTTLKRPIFPIKSASSPINTGAKSYEINSDTDGRMVSNEFAAHTYDAASRITGITQNLWASRTVTQVIGTGTAVVTERYLTPLSWQASYDRRNRVVGFDRAGSST